MGSDVADLERRLAALEDERGVLDLLYRYGQAIDYGLEEEWADCFAPDGVFEMRHRKGADGVTSTSGRWDATDRRFDGHAALLDFVRHHTRAPAVYHKHVVVEPRITVTGDQATVASYFMFVHESDGEPRVGSFGRYLDRVVRGADDRWRFAERVAEIEVS